MRQHKIFTRTLLILSILNFAVAAPVAARRRPEVRLGAKVTRDVTAASQKRGPTMNMPGSDHELPPSPDSADIWSHNAYTDNPLPTPDNLGSGHVPPGQELPTGSRLIVGSIPVAGSPSLPPPLESWSSDVSGLHYAPPPSSDLESTDILEQMAEQKTYTDSPQSLPDSLGLSTGSGLPVGSMLVFSSLTPSSQLPELHPSQPGPSEHHIPGSAGLSDNQLTPTPTQGVDPETHFIQNLRVFVNKAWDNVLRESRFLGTLLITRPHSPPPPLPHPSQPGPSEGRFPGPSGISVKIEPEELSPTGPTDHFLFRNPSGISVKTETESMSPSGSTGTQPTLLEPDPEIHSLVQPETFPTEFWDDLLKGKIKRHIPDSGAVNLAQNDPRFLNFPGHRLYDAALPLHDPLGQLRN